MAREQEELGHITTKAAKANTLSASLRTTIPEEMVRDLRLEPTDVIEWTPTTHEGHRGYFVWKMGE